MERQLQKHLLHRAPIPFLPFLQHLALTTIAGNSSGGEIPKLYPKITQARPPPVLTPQELTTVNLLIPRLCLSDQVTTAVHLAAASLPVLLATDPLANPAKALSFSILVHSLASHPDMAPPMSLLTILSHSPAARPHLPDIAALLIASYLRKMRPLEALKVYKWVGRRFPVGRGTYGVVVGGLCEGGMVVEAVRVARDMVGAGVVPGGGLRRRVYELLLKEALVGEAMEWERGLRLVEGDNGLNKVGDLLDSMLVRLRST